MSMQDMLVNNSVSQRMLSTMRYKVYSGSSKSFHILTVRLETVTSVISVTSPLQTNSIHFFASVFVYQVHFASVLVKCTVEVF
jgi:hypothetical protein